ncbi:hypothetical protein J7I98_24125 [Streptomyces sp. ISL-98]|uniref:polysaccharide biosynthesis tyrosine autokinase n=1 Tax=Streptomyces sp. ISL-98 TaxID=2819192 RepID=UPI001BE5464E|nr:polysaccharide biosynthesis tyrosine autokinase [Streptomyces sp. ISL-98]MBT2508915.1 hypothetical protein [Streptomyces sp. ISL-98]
MDLRTYLRLFRRRWSIILLLTVLGTAAGAAVAWTQPPVYAAKTQMIVTAADTVAEPSEAYQGGLLAQQRAKSYTNLVTSQHVVKTLIDEMQLPYSVQELQGKISATNPTDTAVIDFTVEDRSAQRAKEIADSVGPVLSRVVAGVESPPDTPQSGVTETGVSSLAPAQLLPGPVSPKKQLDMALGLVAGLVLGIGAAVVREVTDRRVRDVDDLVRAAGVSVLGVVPDDGVREGNPLPTGGQRPPRVIEAYRRLGINLQLTVSGSGPQTYVLTEPSGGGATATAAGLAIAMAEGGTSVALVDADTSDTRLARLLGLSPGVGLRAVLAEQAPLDLALRKWRADLPLLVLTSGEHEPGSGQAPLREGALVALRAELERRADVVIFASPPVLTQTDAVVLGRAVGQVVVVARTKAARSDELGQAVQYLRAVGIRVLGAILTQANGRRGDVWARPAQQESGPGNEQGQQVAGPTIPGRSP